MKTYMTLQAKEDQERDEYRARAEAAEAERDALRSEVARLRDDLVGFRAAVVDAGMIVPMWVNDALERVAILQDDEE